jgi:hypothetical protein
LVGPGPDENIAYSFSGRVKNQKLTLRGGTEIGDRSITFALPVSLTLLHIWQIYLTFLPLVPPVFQQASQSLLKLNRFLSTRAGAVWRGNSNLLSLPG